MNDNDKNLSPFEEQSAEQPLEHESKKENNPIDDTCNMGETDVVSSQEIAENTIDKGVVEKGSLEVAGPDEVMLNENKDLKAQLKKVEAQLEKECNEKGEIKKQLEIKEGELERCKLDKEFEKNKSKLVSILLTDDYKERFEEGNVFFESLKDEWCRGKQALHKNEENQRKLEEFRQTQCANQAKIKDLEDKRASLERNDVNKTEIISKLQDDKRKLQEEKRVIEQTNEDLKTKNQGLENAWDGLSQGIRNSLLLRDSNVFTDNWLEHFINQAFVGEEGYPKEKALSLYIALIYFVFLDNSKEKTQQSVAESIQKLGEAYMGYLHDYKRDNHKSACEQLRALAEELNARPLLKEAHVELWVPSMNDVVDNSTMNCKSPTNIVNRVYNWKVLMNGITYCKALVG